MLRKRSKPTEDQQGIPTPKRPAITPMKLTGLATWDFPDDREVPDSNAALVGRRLTDLGEAFPVNGGHLYREVRVKEKTLGEVWRRFGTPGCKASRYVYVLETSDMTEFDEGFRSAISEVFSDKLEEIFVEFQGVRNLYVTRNFARLENTTISDWKLWHDQGIKFSNPLLGRQPDEFDSTEFRAAQSEIRQWNKENGGVTADLVLELEDLTHVRSLTQQEIAPSSFSGALNVFSLLDVLREDCIKCGRLPRIIAFSPFDRAQRRPLRLAASRAEFDALTGCLAKFDGPLSARLLQDLLNDLASLAKGVLEVEVFGVGRVTKLTLTIDKEWLLSSE